MKVKKLLVTLSMLVAATTANAFPYIYPTGTTWYTPQSAFNGYTLFSPLSQTPGQGHVFLIDMRGNLVRRWTFENPVAHARLQPNGNLDAMMFISERGSGELPGGKPFRMGGETGILREYDWEGKLLFEYKDLNMHHDFVRLPGGNLMYLGWERVPPALQKKIRGGYKGSELEGGTMFTDYLREVDRQGATVWEWHASEHLDPDIDIMGPAYVRREWTHSNGLDVRGNKVLLTSRHTDRAYLIDRSTGKIVSRYGGMAYLDEETGLVEHRWPQPEVFGGPHACNFIEDGYPGGGNILCYDNGTYTKVSRAVEFDVTSGKILWDTSVTPSSSRHPFSVLISNAQRLPNGNTLMCEGTNGRLYELNPEKEVVWEYLTPFRWNPPSDFSIFKSFRYGPDYCPQFKTLPPAVGTAVTPPRPGHFRVPTAPDAAKDPLAELRAPWKKSYLGKPESQPDATTWPPPRN